MGGQHFEAGDLNRQFNSRPVDKSERSADGWSRYESQESPGIGQGGGGAGYDSSKYGTRPPPSSTSTSSRPADHQMRGGMSSEGFMGGSSELKGHGRMGDSGGMAGMGQGYRSSGAPTSMGGTSSGAPTLGSVSNGPSTMGGISRGGAPIISEGRRGAMAASGGLAIDRGIVGSFYSSEAQSNQGWLGEQRQGGPNTTMANKPVPPPSHQPPPSHTSFPPPGASMASMTSFPPPGIPGNFPPPTSRTDGPPPTFNAGGSSGFNTANGSFNRPPGGHGGSGGYDSSKYGRARNKPS